MHGEVVEQQARAAYQVYDVLARTDRALKLVLKDRESVLERLQHEYQILLNLPAHPHVVTVSRAIGSPDTAPREKRREDGEEPEFYRDLPEHYQLTRQIHCPETAR
ncbi:hypothetical protein [Mycobacterium sp. 141]|uniref:hypothetical protein n=1 Tax=Mycobacterium sp. 141 TaxID=1120797 RepID=UPI0012DDB6CE|nr:hypothetical protein [Mycobacterium sp. 141]